MLKDSTCHSPNFQHFTDFQITANCLKMLTNSGKKSVTKALLVYTEISLHSVYITLSHTAITTALQQLTTINISVKQNQFCINHIQFTQWASNECYSSTSLIQIKTCQSPEKKMCETVRHSGKGLFFSGGGSTACDVVCLNF